MIWMFRRFHAVLGRYRARLTVGAGFTILSSFSSLAQPWPLKVIVDSVLRGKPLSVPGFGFAADWSRTALLNGAIVAFVVILVAGAACDYAGNYLMDSSGIRIVADIRELLFSRLQRLSLRFHGTQRTGDLTSRLMSDIGRLQDMLIQWFSVLVPNVVLLTGMMVVMFLVDWEFTLIALAVAPALFLVAYRYTHRIKSASRRARSLEGSLAARATEVLGAVRVVQAFTSEEREDRRFSEQSSQTVAANLEATRLQSEFSPFIDVIAGIGTALVLFVGTHRVLSGELSLGLLLVFLSYLNSLYRPMRLLSRLSYVTSRGLASGERVVEVLDAEDDVVDAPDAVPAPRLRGNVAMHNVEFAYTDRHAVLNGISLDVPEGEMVALVGPTGAGKTTLVSLIPRFFDPRSGSVTIDGTDVRTLKLQSLRSQIAIVTQEPILFDGTIFDNIAYGRPDATEADVRSAAEAALVDDFARRLPEGYDTLVGERGAALSGGERQRVSIARAIVRDAPILILDEPTSSLDPQSERLLIEALENLVRARTTFVIAHRMSTVAGADRVVVLSGGTIIEEGTHDELARERAGVYRSYLESQLATPRLRTAARGPGGSARAGNGRRSAG